MSLIDAVVAPPVPERAVVFRSDELDEVRSITMRTDGEHSRVVHGRGRLGYERHILPGRRAALYWGRVDLAQTVRGTLRDPIVHVAVEGASRYRFGSRQHELAPGSVALITAGGEFTRHSEPGFIFGIGVDAAALAAEVQSRRGDDEAAATTWALHSRVVPNGHAFGNRLASAAAELSAALQSDDAAAPRDHCEARLVALLADLLDEQSAVVGLAAVAARRVADLEAWIEAHLREPITMGRLCEVAGVGDRSLQLAFQARRGLSPMRFVTERRLSAAHRMLQSAGRFDDVTGVAWSVGFTHLGRFALAYKQVYGESPSQTLRGARRRS